MGIVQNIVKGMKGNKAEFKEKFRQAQEEDKVYSLIEERKKSSNLRELERYYREGEEARVKVALRKIHDKQNRDNWKSNPVLKSQKSILANDRPILKEKNIFKGNSNMFTKEHAIKNKTDMGYWK